MSIWNKLFGGSAVMKAPTQSSYKEKDNRGSRQDTESLATAYWMSRMSSSKKDPFVVYAFDTEEAARKALLEVPCIHVAEDTGKLICSEVLTFGYYRTSEGKHEAIVCGGDLTHELWEKAKAGFIQHGGRPKGQGDLEPEKKAAPAPKPQAADPGKVKFVKEDRQNRMGAKFIYRIHKAPDAASAKAFLEKNPVSQPLYYLVVETPEGNYCRDKDGIYKE
jgi:hypothetical protein